ncbi:nucleolar protein dao-5-like [Maniola jurtina]|uniref:nucleolar protein dao-5-like n=1 Tax=Maniola jurtina TaxID=191418 RepID=UPI001E68C129|nr:nucleolar protein dao-5-like [Maniola jurtina]
MPSKTRGRAAKASKENISVVKTKSKAKVLKESVRKPLSDKTNSASDDNASVVSDSKKPVVSVPDKQINDDCNGIVKRSRRARRLPTRYKENNVLKNLSNSLNLSTSHDVPAFKTPSPVQEKSKVTVNNTQPTKNLATKATVLAKKNTSPVKKVQLTPTKNPVEILHSNLVKNRPKRICRLPSKYEDHSISPNKYIPLQPINASTPFATKSKKVINSATTNISAIQNISPVKLPNLTSTNINKRNTGEKRATQNIEPEKQPILVTKNKNTNNKIIEERSEPEKRPKRATRAKKINDENNDNFIDFLPDLPTKRATKQKAVSNGIRQKAVADSNNNAKKNNKAQESPPKSPGKIFKSREIGLNKNTSLRLLDDNKNLLKRDSSKLDVYEFTFNPDEEPSPAKKKKKKAAPRKPKPKTVPSKSKYDRNLAKALAALRNTVATKSSNTQNGETNKNGEVATTIKENINNVDANYINTLINEQHLSVDKEQSIVNAKNYNSVRVEDIARDFQMDEDDHAIDYSPVHSPSRPKTPSNDVQCSVQVVQTPNNLDPLNLRDDSFFHEIPVASSSMNVSVRHPEASPWRAEFGSLPIKWQVNTYVKPNMTPAFESSFINFNDDNKKKHVYTNIVPEANDPIPEVDNTTNLKQTSIISFIKEVVERNANKKNKKSTPVKANSLFEDLASTSVVNYMTPNKETPFKDNNIVNITPESEKQHSKCISYSSNEKENSDIVKTPKDLNKSVDKNNTYYGFDEVEEQENVSPVKINNRAKSLRSRTRGILQEINEYKGPTRGHIPVAAKSNSVNRNEMKSATEPPIFPEVAADGSTDTANVQESCVSENLDNDDQSVHLFEDIDLLFIHHPKPSRKSYGKAKKVTFVQKPVVGSDDSSMSDQDIGDRNASISSEEDNLEDLSFKLPTERPKKTVKKRKPKKILSKKEEKEVEAWAAGFNSMCEDIDGFDLVVEE